MRALSSIYLALLVVLVTLAPVLAEPDAVAQKKSNAFAVFRPEGMTQTELDAAIQNDLGTKVAGGIPVAILVSLTELKPERFGATLQEMYHRYGFLFRKSNADLPIGIIENNSVGLKVHQFNCLACHAGLDPEPAHSENPVIVVGATNKRLEFSGWYADIFNSLTEIARAERTQLQRQKLDFKAFAFSKTLARISAAARRGMARHKKELNSADMVVLTAMVASTVDRVYGDVKNLESHLGPGRTLVQGAYRVLRFNLPPGPNAPVKAPDLFGVKYRENLLWTGNEQYLPEQSAAEKIARNGMLVPWIQVHPLTRKPVPDAVTASRYPLYLQMGKTLAKVEPPESKAPQTKQGWRDYRAGQKIFENTCASCHGSYSHKVSADKRALKTIVVNYTEELVLVEDVGTDRNYSLANNEEFKKAFEESFLGRYGLFKSVVTKSYVPRPLLGLRTRAPFLHNGSVPNLRALLTAPDKRPEVFMVGASVPFDSEAVGLKLITKENFSGSVGRRFGRSWRDTTTAGNRAIGHPYGTDLKAAQKKELIAFLKTL